jgi:hypothetical protein
MKVGFDIDGVLAPDFDLPGSPSLRTVNLMVRSRRIMVPLWNPLAVCKELGHEVVFITSRPVSDKEDTRAFLKQLQHSLDTNELALIIQTSKRPLSIFDAAEFKAKAIISEKVDVFIESCPEQAALIRTQVPTPTRVIPFERVILTGIINILRSSCST